MTGFYHVISVFRVNLHSVIIWISTKARCLKVKWLQRESNQQPLSLQANTQSFSQTRYLASLAKWVSVRLWNKWLWVGIALLSLDKSKSSHAWLVFKDIDIASLETLAMLANDWHFLKNPNIISYYFNPLKIREH